VAYGFIRNTDTWGVNSIPWQAMANAGLTPLFAANDKNLDYAMAYAKQNGRKAGVWIPAGGEGDPRAYAARIKALYDRYGSDIVPNIEFTGKGYKGSQGWQWNEDMMSELQRLGIPKGMAIAMLGNQQDFNYGAYASRGVKLMPEAFGADTGRDLYDPDQMRKVLRDQGVQENMIDTLLAPTQARRRGGSVFTIDDLSPEQLAALPPALQDRGLVPLPQGRKGIPIDPTNEGFAQVRDAQNPEAVAYSRMRLAQLRRMGYTPEQFGITGDPTAQWRQMSAIMGANQSARAGRQYTAPAGLNEGVAGVVNKLITGEQKPFIPRGNNAGFVQAKPRSNNAGFVLAREPRRDPNAGFVMAPEPVRGRGNKPIIRVKPQSPKPTPRTIRNPRRPR
jgi:hypothetical protein